MPTWEMLTGFNAGRTFGGNAERYFSLYGQVEQTSGEAPQRAEANESYTWANLFVRLTANANDSNQVFRGRINAVNGNMSVTFTTGTTGVQEDTVNTDSLVSGDLFDYRKDGLGIGNITITMLGSTLQHASSEIGIIGAFGDHGNIAFGSTSYLPILGDFEDDAVEANSQYTFRAAATLRNFQVHCTSYSLNADNATYRIRVNGANGGQSVVFTATGRQEDTVNTDSIAVGDEVNISCVTGGTSGGVTSVLAQCESASVGIQLAAISATGAAISSDVYITAQGTTASGAATESNIQKTARSSFTAKNMFTNNEAHGASSGVNIYLRRNGANSILTVNIPASTTGIVEDTVNTVSFVATDTYNYFVDHGGGAGSITMNAVGFELAQPSTITDAEIAIASQQSGQTQPVSLPLSIIPY